ncbi:MAG: DUF4743 domain-containing protein [Candidatus Symbiobacter sp.]|nr:DUF4743 domain-containing protein [Candidatus Symbiobacter sp.]
MSLLRHVTACNDANLKEFIPFYLGGVQVGWVHPDGLAGVREFMPELTDIAGGIGLTHQDISERNRIFAHFAHNLVAAGKLRRMKGEDFAVLPIVAPHQTEIPNDFFTHPLAVIDRKAVPFLGIQGFGVHLNGILRNSEQEITALWIARRNHDRAVAPGKLDNMVAGGQGAYFTPRQSLVKEGGEEAGLSPDLIAQARAVRLIRYVKNWELPGWGPGLRHDVLFAFDLEMPNDITPRNTDGEIAEFFPMRLAEIRQALEQSDDFKFNVTLVKIDFLLRHGFLTEQHPEYQAILSFFGNF